MDTSRKTPERNRALVPADRIDVELHSHSYASPDSTLTPERILAICQERGLERIAITDHNSIAGARAAARNEPSRVIVGEEILTTGGEILAYFVQEEIPAGLSPQEVITELRGQGALISISHPFDPSRSPWDPGLLADLSAQIDAVEVFNGRAFGPGPNRAAARFAREHSLLGTAGSDAHSGPEIGRVRMRLPAFQDAHGMRAALQSAEIIGGPSPVWMRLSSRWAVLRKALGWKPPDPPTERDYGT